MVILTEHDSQLSFDLLLACLMPYQIGTISKADSATISRIVNIQKKNFYIANIEKISNTVLR